MRISPDELKQLYRNMPDGELLAIEPSELTEAARKVYEDEIAHRAFDAPDQTAPADGEETADGWACAGGFFTADEAEMVRALLDEKGIAARVDEESGDLVWMGSNAVRVSRIYVPEPRLEDAQSAIETNAARQEIAAREHAAAAPVVITARYEEGVFKPLEEVILEEGTEVEVYLPVTAPEEP